MFFFVFFVLFAIVWLFRNIGLYPLASIMFLHLFVCLCVGYYEQILSFASRTNGDLTFNQCTALVESTILEYTAVNLLKAVLIYLQTMSAPVSVMTSLKR